MFVLHTCSDGYQKGYMVVHVTEDVEKSKPLPTASGRVRQGQPHCSSLDRFSLTVEYSSHVTQRIKDMSIQKCVGEFTAAFLIPSLKSKPPRFGSVSEWVSKMYTHQ